MARLYSRNVMAGVVALMVSGCGELGLDGLFQGGDGAEADMSETAALAAASGNSVERDIEAPEVFSANEPALWDGRPSLGGVWVAHPDVTEPERVIIRNEENGSFVIGALFRRERDNPGPRIQVSSDAADTLGMLAGQPTALSVVALRRQEIEVPAGLDAAPGDGTVEDDPLLAADTPGIEASTLDPVDTAAAPAAAPAPQAEEPTTAETLANALPAALGGELDKPFIQIGIFSVEENASNTATSLRNIGIVPTVLQQESNGKSFWRVIVGPTTNASERRTVLGQVRELGFEDAYFVTN